MSFDYETVTWGGGDVIAPDRADFLDHSLHLRYALEALQGVNGRVLEIGCGSGRFIASVAHARPDLEAHGSDVSKTALAIAEKRPRLAVAVADALRLPYPDGHFSAVLMIDVLEHLPDPAAALREAMRVLAAGGVFHLVFPCEGHRATLHGLIGAVHALKRKHAGHIQRFSPAQLRALLGDAGFRIEKEVSSYHVLGQLYDVLVFSLLEAGIDMHRARQDKIESGKPGAVAWIRRGVSALLYAEARLFARTPIGMTLHVTARESDVIRQLAALVLLLVVLLAAVSGYSERTFDGYVHMFFADHYLRGWLDLWEPRWYGGFSVTTYPPLAHQCLALLASVLGHERGFVVLIALATLSIAWLIADVTQLFSDNRTVFWWALLLAALAPTVPRFAYVYGQLPTLLATAFALAAVLALDRFLQTRSWLWLGQFAAWIGCTAGAHHVTLIFVAFGCVLITVRALVVGNRAAVLRRALGAAVVAGCVVLAVVWPFLRYATTEPQTEIPHFSRDPLSARPSGLDVIEQLSTAALALVGAVVAVRRKQPPLLVLALGTAFLVLLSTGGTTPLPRWLFGAQWRWLTYDKFHLWAALGAVALLATLLQPSTRRSLAAVGLCLPLTILQASHKASDALQPPFIHDLSPLLAVLGRDDAPSYRHLTLGFGDQLCRLDIYGRSPSVDGDYHTARRDPTFVKSGIATVDAAKYFDNGPDILRGVLGKAETTSLRWVFVYDDWYYPFLFDAGFDLKEVWPNGVTLFEKAVPVLVPESPAPATLAARLTWGALPLTALFSALCLRGVLALRQRRPTRRVTR